MKVRLKPEIHYALWNGTSRFSYGNNEGIWYDVKKHPVGRTFMEVVDSNLSPEELYRVVGDDNYLLAKEHCDIVYDYEIILDEDLFIL